MAFTWADFQQQNISAKSVAVEIVRVHRRTGASSTVYYSTDGFVTGPGDTPASTVYADRIVGGVSLEENLYTADGRLGGQSQISTGVITLNNADGALDTWDQYTVDNQTITVKVAEVGTAIGDYYTALTLVGMTVTVDTEVVTITVSDRQAKLALPIQGNVYAGTGPALWFTRSDTDYLEASVPPSSRLVDPVNPVGTVEAWVLIEPPSAVQGFILCDIFDSTAASVASLLKLLVTNAADDTFSVSLVYYSRPDNTNVQSHTWTASGQAATNTGRPVHLAWSRIAGLLLNGVVIDSTGADGVPFPDTMLADTIRIGESWDGIIDEFRIWTVARTAEQIRQNMHRPLEGTESGLLHYWKLDDNTGTTAADSGPGNLTLTLDGSTGTPDWIDGLQGGEGLQGKTKPLTYGRVLNAKPALVGEADLIYQFHDGTGNAVNAVYDQGVALDLDTNQTDLYTFLTTTPTASQYDTYLPLSLIRLGSAPAGQVTCDVDGAEDANGNYLRHYEEIVREIVTDKGGLTDPDDLDTDSFDAIENEPADGMGIYIAPGESALISTVLDRLAASVTGYWYFDASDNLRVGILGLPSDSPTLSFTVDDDTMTFERLASRIPVWRLRVGYQHNYNVQDADAVDVTEARRLFLEQEVRVVELSNRAVQTIHPLAGDLPVQDEGLLSTRAAAKTEARRQFKLYGRTTEGFSASRPGLAWADLRLGNTVRITHDRFGLGDGEEYVVLGIQRNLGHETDVELTLWRPEPWVMYGRSSLPRITRGGAKRIAR